MEAAVIRVSSKGQIVIPAEWRNRLGVQEGSELLAIGDGDMLLLKRIEKTSLRKEFDEASKKMRTKARKLGITRKDLQKAVNKAKGS